MFLIYVMIRYYVPKPKLVKAVKYKETNKTEVMWFIKYTKHFTDSDHNIFIINDIDGEKIKISFGDYIVKLGSSFKVYSEEEFNNEFNSFINEKEED